MKTKEMVVGKIEQLTASGEFILPEAKLVDCLNKNHPLVVEYVKDLKEENQLLKEKNKKLSEDLTKAYDQQEERRVKDAGRCKDLDEIIMRVSVMDDKFEKLKEELETTEKMYQGALDLLTAKEEKLETANQSLSEIEEACGFVRRANKGYSTAVKKCEEIASKAIKIIKESHE